MQHSPRQGSPQRTLSFLLSAARQTTGPHWRYRGSIEAFRLIRKLPTCLSRCRNRSDSQDLRHDAFSIAMRWKRNLEKYSQLWTDATGHWAVFHLNRDVVGATPEYGIVNLEDRSALVIEDDAIAAAVKRKMLAAGVNIVWRGGGF